MERKLPRLASEEMKEITERAFQAYGRPLNLVTSFKYLGRNLTASDYYWPTLVGNLSKASKKWIRLSIILGWKGDNPQVLGVLFKVVAQAIIFFKSEM